MICSFAVTWLQIIAIKMGTEKFGAEEISFVLFLANRCLFSNLVAKKTDSIGKKFLYSARRNLVSACSVKGLAFISTAGL